LISEQVLSIGTALGACEILVTRIAVERTLQTDAGRGGKCIAYLSKKVPETHALQTASSQQAEQPTGQAMHKDRFAL